MRKAGAPLLQVSPACSLQCVLSLVLTVNVLMPMCCSPFHNCQHSQLLSNIHFACVGALSAAAKKGKTGAATRLLVCVSECMHVRSEKMNRACSALSDCQKSWPKCCTPQRFTKHHRNRLLNPSICTQEAGADPSLATVDGHTPLTIASENGHSQVRAEVLSVSYILLFEGRKN